LLAGLYHSMVEPQLTALGERAAWVDSTARTVAKYLWFAGQDGELGKEGWEGTLPLFLQDECNDVWKKAMARVEELEDTLAATTALHEKAEAEIRCTQAKLERSEIEKKRFEQAVQELIDERKKTGYKMTNAYSKLAETMEDLDSQRASNKMLQEELLAIRKKMDMLEVQHLVGHDNQSPEPGKLNGTSNESVLGERLMLAMQERDEANRCLSREQQIVAQLEEKVKKLERDVERRQTTQQAHR